MFGSFGMSELVILLVALGFIGAFMRRGALAATGPVLVLRRFDVAQAGDVAVNIEGRPGGFIAWLLTTIGLDTKTTLVVTEREVRFRMASLSGEIHQVVPTTQIASTHCGYAQPIWLLISAGVIVLLGMLGSLSSRESTPFIGGLLIGGICVAVYLLQRKIAMGAALLQPPIVFA